MAHNSHALAKLLVLTALSSLATHCCFSSDAPRSSSISRMHSLAGGIKGAGCHEEMYLFRRHSDDHNNFQL